MNRFLFKFWYVPFSIFVILTVFYARSNREFETNIRAKIAKEGNQEFVTIHPQVFTPLPGREAFEKIDPEKWKVWQGLVSPEEIAEPYKRSFKIDNFWAACFITLIYLLAICPTGSSRLCRLLAVVLIFAYLSDLFENYLYAWESGNLYQWIPQVCAIKMALYIAGIAISLSSFVGNVRALRK